MHVLMFTFMNALCMRSAQYNLECSRNYFQIAKLTIIFNKTLDMGGYNLRYLIIALYNIVCLDQRR